MNEYPATRRAAVAALLLLACCSRPAAAQEGTLLYKSSQTPDGPTPLTIQNSSYMYQPLSPEARARELKVNAIVTVLVDYRANVNSEGDAESRKTASLNAKLADWIGFDGKSIFRAPQSRGDPAIQGSLNSIYRAEGELTQRDSMTFRIAATVVDIRPNGNLVIEAHREIANNDEVWITSLTGEVSRQSIGPDNVVRSDAISNLQITKKERGQVRNSYAPGWLGWWWSRFHAI
jgi:flagellar L-ring protein precursor FlgH